MGRDQCAHAGDRCLGRGADRRVDGGADTTTLYASDRDVFLFLVDDTHPIEAGRLPNGEPDLYFRGF